MTNSYIEVLPDPSRMVEGLRDTGYSFETAVADLVDNSIAADATVIKIWIQMDFSGEITLMIADNGIGMDEVGLVNAMKYGSSRRESPHSLGKFGLGLKTASTAFCRCLSVVTRPRKDQPVYKAVWDLDHVKESGKWEVLMEAPEEVELRHLDIVANGASGTLVIWKKIDRLLKEYKVKGGQTAQRALKGKKTDLNFHLSMVYQRFLDPSDPREQHKISIWLDDQELKPWDPFRKDESTPVLETTAEVEDEESETLLGKFTIKAFVLPRKEDFSSIESWQSARLSNKLQGMYIYRENRLIHFADWLGMWDLEPHLTLLRVEFSFDESLDDAFEVDIKKSKITLHDELRRWLKDEFLPPARRAAEDRSRKGTKRKEGEKVKGAHRSSNTAIGYEEGEIGQAGVKVINAAGQDVDVTNAQGTTRIKLRIVSPGEYGEHFIKPVPSIDDGLLWQPALIDGKQGIELNMGHPFYRKVYIPEIVSDTASDSTVQGIDSLLWALGISELMAVNEATKGHFQELRYEVSKILRKLVEHLPEPPEIDE